MDSINVLLVFLGCCGGTFPFDESLLLLLFGDALWRVLVWVLLVCVFVFVDGFIVAFRRGRGEVIFDERLLFVSGPCI